MIGASFDYTTLALVSAIGTAVFNMLAYAILRQINYRQLLIINFIILGLLLSIFAPWFYHFNLNRQTALWLAIVIGLDTFGNYFYFKSFSKTTASGVTPILALSPAFTFMISWLVLPVTAPWWHYVMAIIIIGSVIVFSLEYKNLKQFSAHTLIPALISAACFGLSAIPVKLLLTAGDINPPTLYLFRAWGIGLIIWLIFRESLCAVTWRQIGQITVRSLVVLLSWSIFYYALAAGDAGITVTLNSTAPVFVFILSAIFLKETMTWKKFLAAGLIVVLSLML